jgi:hypothetical protein
VITIKNQFTDEVMHEVPGDTLAGARLAGAVLPVASLTEADLRGANLRGANLAVAHLDGANLSGCDLRGADLTGANLIRAVLAGANLRGAALTGADLGHAVLDGANLCDANLSGANLTGADLCQTRLQGANLSGAAMSYARLDGAEFDDRTQFPALLFAPEGSGAVRAAAPPGEAEAEAGPGDPATQDAGEPVVEALFRRATDGTPALHVRTAAGWLPGDRPTDALAGLVQHALATPAAEVRAYTVNGAVGLVVRSRRPGG